MGFPGKGLIWVLDNKKIGFLHITKCASTSIRLSHDFKKDNYVNWDKNKINNFFKFAVLRNPYNRFLSGYSESLTRKESKLSGGLDEKIFKNTIKNLENKEFVDIHLVSQVEFIGDLKINKFIKFENLNNELNNLADEINLPKLKNMHKKQQTYTKHLVNKMVEKLNVKNIINEIYKEDWKLYNKLFR